jgi:hypothetical protein
MRDQEAWTVRKTGPALGEAPPVKVEPAPVAELPPIQAPPVQIPIEKLAASINRDWAEIQAAFDANEVERAMSL